LQTPQVVEFPLWMKESLVRLEENRAMLVTSFLRQFPAPISSWQLKSDFSGAFQKPVAPEPIRFVVDDRVKPQPTEVEINNGSSENSSNRG
jgi:hypothetical protein